MKRLVTIISILVLMSCEVIESNQSIESIDVGGNKIHYKIEGDGQELVLVHGGYLNLEMWEVQLNEFKDEYKTIRFSDLGHGLTKSANNPIFGYEIIDKLINGKKETSAILIGLSWGAMLCVDYVLKYPDKVNKLILISPGLNGWDYFQDTIAAINNKLRQIAIKQNDVEKAAKLFHQNWVVGPRRKSSELNPEFLEKSLEMLIGNMKNHWMEDWSILDTIPAIDRLEEIEVPTFIIIGNQDAEDIKMIAKEYDNRVPNSRKIVMDGVAHLLTMEQPKEFNDILRQIMNE